jgi:hypothetical protein
MAAALSNAKYQSIDAGANGDADAIEHQQRQAEPAAQRVYGRRRARLCPWPTTPKLK